MLTYLWIPRCSCSENKQSKVPWLNLWMVARYSKDHWLLLSHLVLSHGCDQECSYSCFPQTLAHRLVRNKYQVLNMKSVVRQDVKPSDSNFRRNRGYLWPARPPLTSCLCLLYLSFHILYTLITQESTVSCAVFIFCDGKHIQVKNISQADMVRVIKMYVYSFTNLVTWKRIEIWRDRNIVHNV